MIGSMGNPAFNLTPSLWQVEVEQNFGGRTKKAFSIVRPLQGAVRICNKTKSLSYAVRASLSKNMANTRPLESGLKYLTIKIMTYTMHD
jgi:hypothetical protein